MIHQRLGLQFLPWRILGCALAYMLAFHVWLSRPPSPQVLVARHDMRRTFVKALVQRFADGFRFLLDWRLHGAVSAVGRRMIGQELVQGCLLEPGRSSMSPGCRFFQLSMLTYPLKYFASSCMWSRVSRLPLQDELQ